MSLINSTTMEKMVLAKRVARFLDSDPLEHEKVQIEDVARQLARDLCQQVREVLAYELRHCCAIPQDIARQIACDVENVSGPFLRDTLFFSDDEMAKMIPGLKAFAQLIIARRSDIGDATMVSLSAHGSEDSILTLVRNDNLTLPQRACDNVLKRFGSIQRVMDQMSARIDLPLEVVEIMVDKVSSHCKEKMVQSYAMDGTVAEKLVNKARLDTLWSKIETATAEQIRGYVIDLRQKGKLTNLLVIEMANRGSLAFFENALALEAGVTLEETRHRLDPSDQKAFVRLMKACGISRAMAPRYLAIAKKYYGNKEEPGDTRGNVTKISSAA